MTRPDYRHRILVIDHSFSIAEILDGQQSGLQEFFASEATVAGKATYSLWDFSDKVRCISSFVPLHEVSGYQIVPGGNTALYDAVGEAVEQEGKNLAGMSEDERPADVTVIVATDGKENVSRKYQGREGGAQVKAMLERQQSEYKWRVIFMGTNMDALAEGAKIGMSMNTSVTYDSSSYGAENAWRSAGAMLKRAPLATASVDGYSFTPEERKLAQSAEGDGTAKE